MTNEIKTFEFNINPIRGLALGGKPWFMTIDVLRVLNFLQPRETIALFCPSCATHSQHQLGGVRDYSIIPLADVETLAAHSKLGNRQAFLLWIHNTMVPGLCLQPLFRQTLDGIDSIGSFDKPPARPVPVAGLVTFDFGTNQIRVVMKDGEPWWIGADVCAVLEIANSRDALTRLDPDEKGVASTDTPGGRQELATVSESGLYSLVLGSRKPEAKAFKRWITHEVIPSLRRTGSYSVQQAPQVPQTLHEALRLAADLAEQRATLTCRVQAQQDTIQEMEPKAAFHDAVATAASSSICVTEMAKLLGTGGVRLYRWLREERIFMCQGRQENLPFQRYIDEGYFQVREGVNEDTKTGEPHSYRQALVTGKGQTWLAKRFTKAVQA